MIILGQILVGIGFLIGASASVVHATELNATWYGVGLTLAIIGTVTAQTGIRRRSRHVDAMATNLKAITESLATLAERSSNLDATKDDIFVYDVHAKVDELFPEPLDVFVEARETISHSYGTQAYADVMNHFAAGERSINRVWSASVDGYIDEVNAYITKAATHFRDANDIFNRLAKGS